MVKLGSSCLVAQDQILPHLLPQLEALDWQLGGLGSSLGSTPHLLCQPEQVSLSLGLSFVTCKVGVTAASHSYWRIKRDHRQNVLCHLAAIWDVCTIDIR